ncbi:MAG: hypothetical protein ACI38U_03285 [Corynebacterium sp.]|uniref:hypothetical protein n=1 Tax=Corynebacterium sp. TaxID=1720 RepID=UPI003EFE67E0
MSNEAKYRKIAEDEGRNFLTEYEFINLAEVYDEDLTESEMRRVHDIITRELRITPDPQIIRTPAELEALDPETWLVDEDGETMRAGEWWYTSYPEYEGESLAVFAEGAHVRACREALGRRELLWTEVPSQPS